MYILYCTICNIFYYYTMLCTVALYHTIYYTLLYYTLEFSVDVPSAIWDAIEQCEREIREGICI